MRLICVSMLLLATATASDTGSLYRAFVNPPADARIMMRWWWFGSAVTKPELEREMRTMRDAGIGGFEVQPVYPVALDDPEHGFRNLPYLSPEFLDALHFTAAKAHELGLRMDITLGSGWPFGGPHIPVTMAAGRLRFERAPVPEGAASLPLPDIGAGEKLLAIFLDHQLISATGGRVILPANLVGTHRLLFFISSRTGQQVKRAAIGAEGFVLDHYDRAAIEHHLHTVADRLIEATKPNVPYAVFSDSLEVFASDWTPDLLDQFAKRRGYDLTPYLPALVEDIGEKTPLIRHDWGVTLTELANERYLVPIREWAHQHGTRFRSQTYGTPPVVLSSNALVDLPEGEGSQWRRFSATRWAASASHLYGRPVTSSETWTWLHSPAFRATPLDMKAEADLHFLVGINQLIGHGWPYSPPSAGEPGWRFYAAAALNDHNPWWAAMPELTRYLQRVSFLLRQGQPANDVAIYLPTHDAYARFTTGNDSVDRLMNVLLGRELIPGILDAGYNFDFIDDAAIEHAGVPYPVLILPGIERIPAATVQRLQAYVAKGGIVIATRRSPIPFAHLVPDERTLGVELNRLLPPDFPAPSGVGFVHRRLDGADVYFVANTTNRAQALTPAPRVRTTHAEWWNPFDGSISPAGAVELEPYESRILVMSDGVPVSAPAVTRRDVMDLSTGWKLTFPGHTVQMDRLRSWDEDPATRFFSGNAAYEKAITLDHVGARMFLNFGEGSRMAPANINEDRPGMRAWLESPVREVAEVYVNDQRAGVVWKPPYDVDVTRLLHTGTNRIRIVVGNTAINELAGQSPPSFRLLNLRYGERFTPQDMDHLQPLPSGLLGPIRLVEQ